MATFFTLYEGSTETTDIQIEDTYKEIYDRLDVGRIEDELRNIEPGLNIDIGELFNELISGNSRGITGNLFDMFIHAISNEINLNKTLMIELIFVILFGSVFVNISGKFGGGFVGENGFYVTYLIMTSIMLTAFSVSFNMAMVTINRVLSVIKVIVPVYALAMNYVGLTQSSVGMYEIIMIIVWIVELAILNIILPMIEFYVIISMVNNLNQDDNFSKLCELIRNSIRWLIKSIVFFIVGLNIIKSMIEPQIDALGRNTVSRIVQSIPGGVASVLAGTFLGAGIIVKNSIGIIGVILLCLVILVPVVKLIVILLIVKLTGALLQPIGDKRYAKGIDAFSQGISLLLMALGSSSVMFMLTIAIITFAGNAH